MKKNGLTLLFVAALVLAAGLALPQPAQASCVYMDGCNYCVQDGGCCWQIGPCGCEEFQCRNSVPKGFVPAEERTTDWWAAVVAHAQTQIQEAKLQQAKAAETVAR